MNKRKLEKIRRKNFMLEGWEWLIIGVVAIVIIMWGPAKIPEFARSLGRAKGEFSKATKEFTDAANATVSAPTPAAPVAPAPQTAQTSTLKSKDEVLLETAKNLGIETQGKTREQLAEEIKIKIKLLGSD
jgi:sec-independent protein translocase protein TatA